MSQLIFSDRLIVTHRVGDLENVEDQGAGGVLVTHRVGDLEICLWPAPGLADVTHRVGDLEKVRTARLYYC